MSEATEKVKTAVDAYALIHRGLGQWIEGALGDGFNLPPMEDSESQTYVEQFIAMADHMAALERKIMDTPNDQQSTRADMGVGQVLPLD